MSVFAFNGTIYLEHARKCTSSIMTAISVVMPALFLFNEKTFKTFSGTRKTSSNQNSHSLQRNSTHKHGTGNGNRNPETARSGKHTANKETGGGKVNKGGKTRGQGHHSSHVSEVSQGLHVSGAPEVTGPRGHHSHDAHYFVDY